MVSKNSFSFNNNGENYMDYMVNNQEKHIIAQIFEHKENQEDKFPFSKYVVYKIELITSIKNWSIWKRYTNFVELREKMNKHLVNIPEFPVKKIFNTKDTIKERKIMLTKFLNNLLTKEKLLCYKELQYFIDIDKETLKLMFNKDNLEVTSNSLKNTFCVINNTNNEGGAILQLRNDNNTKMHIYNNYYTQFLDYKLSETCSKTPYMFVVEEFLKNLEEKPQNKSSIIKTFESFLKSSKKGWPINKTDEIQKLFFGDIIESNTTNDIHLRGLLSHCGDLNNSIGAEECLHLIVKLLDSEYNPEYEKYLIILKQLKLENIESMNLVYHLDSNKTKVNDSIFKLLDRLYIDKSMRIEKLLNESGLWCFYEKFVSNDSLKFC